MKTHWRRAPVESQCREPGNPVITEHRSSRMSRAFIRSAESDLSWFPGLTGVNPELV
jgi:hypothetical protein